MFRSGELMAEHKRAVAERALNAEMDHRLDDDAQRAGGNHRGSI